MAERKREQEQHGAASIIGWREFVSMPDWEVGGIEAKIDTGAKTSALHVDNIKRLRGGRVRFDVVLSRKRPDALVPVETEIVRDTRVRSSSGHVTHRYVVATSIRIGTHRRKIDMTLVCRKHMLCRMLLGRTALTGFLIDVDEKYVHGSRKSGRKKSRR